MDGANDSEIASAFEALGILETQFADVEVAALRRKEHALAPLYTKRGEILKKIPGLWTQVFVSAPDEISQLYSSADLAALAAIRDFRVERYQITSETQGEPRSLRFTFEFDDNEHFDACTLVKEFEYRPSENGPGDLVSKPVPIKWKNKKDLSKGMLTMAVELEAAEEAMKMKNGGKEIDLVEREGLWQYEKLREAIEKSATADDDEPTFLNWFGFRGAVERRAEKVEEKKENGDVEAEEEDDEDLEDGLLDVEIFPAGEDVAIALAEELFPEAIDIFMSAQDEDDDDEMDFEGLEDSDVEAGDEAPELVEATEVDAEDKKRPSKRQRTQ